jgi:sigma-B regulation protein RsbU (phosphoserine phosphatase)
VFGDATYEEASVPLDPGDRVILFTDGITEARNPADDEFGEERLIEAAQGHRGVTSAALEQHLAAAVGAFTGGNYQDDATLIVMGTE